VNGERSWHLDKRIPVTLILAVLFQTLVLIWYLSGLDSRVNNNTHRITKNELDAKEDRRIVNANSVTVAVTNSSLNDIKASLIRIEAELAVNRNNREK